MKIETNCVGNRWWSIDFHCHTPASSDYGKGVNQVELAATSPKEYLKFYMDKEIDAIVVTDHNSGDWIDKLKSAYIELETEKLDYYRKLVIFPGVELTVNGNVHVLAIFPENEGTSTIDRLLGAIHYRDTKGKSDGCSEVSFVNVIDEITRSGGIAIPAHCNDAKGLFTECSGNTLDQNIKCENIFAAEITTPECEYPQLYIDSKIEWCRVLGSDAHCPTGEYGQKFHGSHYTWVKMSSLTLDELKLSLQDGKMSVKCSDEVTENPNEYVHPVIEKIEIRNAMYLGRQQVFELSFSPWLNTIIGGRGTGKSTIIEFIRTVFNRKNELPKNLLSDFEKYTEENSGKRSNGLMLANTVLSALYIRDNQKYRAEWSFDTGTINMYSYQNGEYLPTDGKIENRFPVRIYSQKQIFELARNPKALLEIINDSDELAYDDWCLEHKKLFNKYFTVCSKIRELQVDVNGVSSIKGELEDINNKINLFKDSEFSEVLDKYSKTRRWIAEIYKVKKYYDERIETMNKFLEEIKTKIQLSLDLDCNNETEKEIIDITNTLQETDKRVCLMIENEIIELDKAKEQWNAKIKLTQAEKEYNEIKTIYEELKVRLEEAGVNDYAELVKKKESLEYRLSKVYEASNQITKLQNEKNEMYQQIIERRQTITADRENFVNKVLENNKYVRINIIPFGDKEDITMGLRAILGREKGFDSILGNDDVEGLISKRINAAKTILEGIESVKKEIKDIYYGEVVQGYDKKFCNAVQSLTEDAIDKLECWFPEDSLDISYSQDNRRFQPIENASPGQKTATLLAFILSYGNEPLILDQPEDDLDNSLISELIVNNLRDEKRHRQIIIVTHNANIVVNGDSDNVTVLHIAGGQTQIACRNGLQNLKIRKYICSIMEGGKPAFKKRYKRINIEEIPD